MRSRSLLERERKNERTNEISNLAGKFANFRKIVDSSLKYLLRFTRKIYRLFVSDFKQILQDVRVQVSNNVCKMLGVIVW